LIDSFIDGFASIDAYYFYTAGQGHPKEPPATQNASQKSSEGGGNNNTNVRGQNLKRVGVYV